MYLLEKTWIDMKNGFVNMKYVYVLHYMGIRCAVNMYCALLFCERKGFGSGPI